MGDFLQYGSVPKGGAVKAPLVPDTDPRGLASDDFFSLVQQQTAEREAEEAAMEALAEENDFGYMNYLGKSIVQESLTANLFGLAEDYVEDFDPGFDPEPFITEDMPAWRQDAIRDAKNPKHAQILLDRTAEQELYEKEGQYHGGMGTVLQLGGAVLNPENFILGAGEVAALSKLGLAGGKRIAAGAAIGALSNTAQEAVIIANNKSRDDFGLAMAAGFGAAFGAVGGLIDPKALKTISDTDKAIGKGLSNSWKRDLDIATGDIRINKPFYRSPDAQYWDEALDAGTGAVDVDGKYTITYGEGENMTAFQYDTKAQAVAAHRLVSKKIEPTPAAVKAQVLDDYAKEAAEYDKLIPKRKGGFWSSIGLEGMSSKNPFTRMLHSQLVEDASGTGGKNVATHSAALKADMNAMKLRSIWHVTRHQQAKAWAKDTLPRNWKPWDTSAMAKFDDAVVQEVAYRGGSKRPAGQKAHPAVAKAADDYQAAQREMISMRQDSDVAGWKGRDLKDTHIQHKWDGVAMTRLTKKFDKETIISLIAKGIMNGPEFKRNRYKRLGAKLDQAYMERTSRNMGKAIYNRFTRRPDTVNMAKSSWLTKADTLELKNRAADLIDNEADLKHLVSAIEGKDARRADELFKQINMDINTEMNGISIRDLLDTNLGASLDTDFRRAAGESAMADAGYKSRDAFHEFTEKAGRWSRENTDMDVKQLEISNEKNQKLWNLVMGENLETDANSTMANFARGFRKASTLASLNQVGFAQIAETGRLVGSIGIKAMMRQIPEWGKMIRDMKNGTFKDAILNDVEAAFGIRLGDNHLLNNPMLMVDSGGVGITKADAMGWKAGMDVVMNKALHVQGYLNGMNAVMKAQHRMHARGFFLRMFDDLNKAKLSPARAKRYADMGLSEADLKVIKKEMDKNVEMGEGWFGQQRPTNFNLVKFSPEIRDKLGLSFWKNQSQAIQRNQGGETAWWMENTAGKFFTQFRTFPIVAIEKQTIHDLKHMDVEAFTTAMAGMGFAALAYSVKTYGNSFGLPPKKRKQYLKNRMTPEKIFAGASAWSGQAAIFPDVMRTAGDFGFSNPWTYTAQKGQGYRDYYRAKGLDLGAIGAAGSMADSAYKAVTGLANVPLGAADLREDVFKNFVRSAPFGNNLAVKVLSNYALEK